MTERSSSSTMENQNSDENDDDDECISDDESSFQICMDNVDKESTSNDSLDPDECVESTSSSSLKRKRTSTPRNIKRSVKRKSDVDENVPAEVMDMIKAGFDDMLEEKAKLTQLTASHVKNIIKNVMTDENVLAMVRNTLVEEDAIQAVYEPKLTRAKTKELLEKQGTEPILPVPVPPPNEDEISTRQLFTSEFPEDDEDEEEYKPDDNSEDESFHSATQGGSDWGSPCTPSSRGFSSRAPSLTPSSTRQSFGTPNSTTRIKTPIQNKIPESTILRQKAVQRTLSFEEPKEELIFQRTRSKQSLSDTPLEQLEMAFKPPDITKDMYEMECDNTDWKNFLIEFMNPSVSTGGDEDEQADPEYNYLADPEIIEQQIDMEERKEEMRLDRAVRVTKREYNELINELLDSFNTTESPFKKSFTPQPTHSFCSLASPPSSSEDREHGFNGSSSEQDSDISDNVIYVEVMAAQFTTHQIDILRSQLMQHVQLLTTSVLLCNKQPFFSNISTKCVEYLKEMKSTAESSLLPNKDMSFYKPINLDHALDTLDKFDKLPLFGIEDVKAFKRKRIKKSYYQLLKRTSDIIMESLAFPYISLFPIEMFHITHKTRSSVFTNSEKLLLAAGLQQHMKGKYVSRGSEKSKSVKIPKEALIKSSETHVVGKSPDQVITYFKKIKQQEKEYTDNLSPVMEYYFNGKFRYPSAEVPKIAFKYPCPVYLVPLRHFTSPWKECVIEWLISRKNLSYSQKPTPPVPPTTQVKNIIVLQTQNGATQVIIPPPASNLLNNNNLPSIVDASLNNSAVATPSKQNIINTSVPDASTSDTKDSTQVVKLSPSAIPIKQDLLSDNFEDNSTVVDKSLSTPVDCMSINDDYLLESSATSNKEVASANLTSSVALNSGDAMDGGKLIDSISKMELSFTSISSNSKNNSSIMTTLMADGLNFSNEKITVTEPIDRADSKNIVLETPCKLSSDDNKGEIQSLMTPFTPFNYEASFESLITPSTGDTNENKDNESSLVTPFKCLDDKNITDSRYYQCEDNKLSLDKTEIASNKNIVQTDDSTFLVPSRSSTNVVTDSNVGMSNKSIILNVNKEKDSTKLTKPSVLNTSTKSMTTEALNMQEMVPNSKSTDDSDSNQHPNQHSNRTGAFASLISPPRFEIKSEYESTSEKIAEDVDSSELLSMPFLTDSPVKNMSNTVIEAQKICNNTDNNDNNNSMHKMTKNSDSIYQSSLVKEDLPSPLTSNNIVKLTSDLSNSTESVINVPHNNIYLVTNSIKNPVPATENTTLPVTNSIMLPNLSAGLLSPTNKNTTLLTAVYQSSIPAVIQTIGNLQATTPKKQPTFKPIISSTKTSPLKQVGPIIRKYRKIKLKTTSKKKHRILPKIKKRITSRHRPIAPKIVQEPPKSPISLQLSQKCHSMMKWKSSESEATDKEDLIEMTDHLYQPNMSDEEDDDLETLEQKEEEEKNEEHVEALLKASSTINKKGNERRVPTKRAAEGVLSKQQSKLQARIQALSCNTDFSSTDKLYAYQYLMKVKEVVTDEDSFMRFINILNDFSSEKDNSPVDLYYEICEILKNFPDLTTEFLQFLEPQQAIQVGRFEEYSALMNSREFLEKLMQQFPKQSQHAQKVLKTIQMLGEQQELTTEMLKSTMAPLLKYPHLMDSFTKCFLNLSPPQSYNSDFEDIDLEEPGTPDSAEHITLPDDDSQISPDINTCKCNCHLNGSSHDPTNKAILCTKCGVRFIDGRVYLKCGKTLRPAKVIFHNEKKDAQNLAGADPPKTSILNSSNHSSTDLLPKVSVSNLGTTTMHCNIKDNNESDKSIKNKSRVVKDLSENKNSGPKTSATKNNNNSKEASSLSSRQNNSLSLNMHSLNKQAKISETSNQKESSSLIPESTVVLPGNISHDLKSTLHCKIKAEQEPTLHKDSSKLTHDIKDVDKHQNPLHSSTSIKQTSSSAGVDKSSKSKEKINITSAEDDPFIPPTKLNEDVCSDKRKHTVDSWTRENDMKLLEAIRSEPPSDKLFQRLSEHFGNKTKEKVEERFIFLMKMIEDTTFDDHL